MATNPPKSNITRDDAGHLDQTLRPQSWEEYVGQSKIKENLRILLTAARERSHAAEHILLYGPPDSAKRRLRTLFQRHLAQICAPRRGQRLSEWEI